MGVEFELKYRADEKSQQRVFAAYGPDWQTITMETTYYDTPGGALEKLHYTLRRRMENGVSVCTVKTPMPGMGRGEWETEANTIETAIPALCKLGAPENLLSLTENGVQPVCGARFTRRAAQISSGGSVLELALDRGELFAGSKAQPLCELEVELKTGTQEDAVLFANLLASTYGLVPETKSKFRRALDLREGE